MKIGIEIHQRIDTHKLFCKCPSKIEETKKIDAEIRRRLHVVKSEVGEIDEAAREEEKREINYIYEYFKENSCLVELDEEPPHSPNKEAIDVGIEIALRLNSKIVDELLFMRKIVIDGSNTSGFQRTGLLGIGGYVETSKGKVRIQTIAIEEESAGIVEKKENIARYRLDRLGIPLIEIATAPDIKDGEHLKETAEKIGLILRSTGKVARGIGTIRQDVNISIDGGERVEIKGAQDLRLLKKIVENEEKRQKTLLEIIDELKSRGFQKINAKAIEITPIFKNTNSKLIRRLIEKGAIVLGLKVEKHHGILGREIQKGKRYGTEISAYAKKGGAKGLIHSDEDLHKYGLNDKEIKEIKERLNIEKGDAFILIVEEKKKAWKSMKNAIKRLDMLYVPKETRRVLPDGTTEYMRPLPGRARMYPETDVEGIEIIKEDIERIKKNMGKGYEERLKELEKLLGEEMAKKVIRSKHLKFFEEMVKKGIEPKVVAATLENTLVAVRREEKIEIEEKKIYPLLEDVFLRYKNGQITKAAIEEIIKEGLKDKKIEEVIKEKDLTRIKGEKLKEIYRKYKGNLKEIMKRYRLKIDVKDINKIKEEMQ